MKKIAITFVVFLILIGIAWFSITRWHRATDRSPKNESTIPTNLTGTNPGPLAVIRQIGSNIGLPLSPSKESQYREGLRDLNHVPIEYYGFVADEIGTPLPSVQVKWSVAYKDGRREGHKTGNVTTDAQGRFSITGELGQSLSVFPEKTGYRLVATNGGAIYSHLWPAEQRHHSDPTNPVRLTMWKLRGAEPLIMISKTLQFVGGDRPVLLDLLTGTPVESGGDLALRINRPSERLSPENRHDWSLKIEALNGALQRVDNTQAQFIFEAPANGYLPSIELGRQANETDWSLRITFTLLVQSRSGTMHSKAAFSFRLSEEQAGISTLKLNSISNPNGSRNWEEEPGKVQRIDR